MKKIVLKFKDKNLILNLRDTPTANMIYDACEDNEINVNADYIHNIKITIMCFKNLSQF